MTLSTSAEALPESSTLTDKDRYWLTHLQACYAAGQTLAGYARAHGLAVKSIYRWRRRLLPFLSEATKATPPAFHRVQLTGSTPVLGLPAKALSLTVQLPNGIACELKAIPLEALTEILRVVAHVPL